MTSTKNRRWISKWLPAVFILGLVNGFVTPSSASAVTPTVSLEVLDGAFAYGGANTADSATGINQEVNFKITLTGLTSGVLPTGIVRVYGRSYLENIYCTSNIFTMNGTTATATCKWQVKYTVGEEFRAEYLTDPTSNTDYAFAASTTPIKIYAAGIYAVYGVGGQIAANSTLNIGAQIYQDFGGEVSFYVDGSPISSCQNVAVTSAQASCPYTLPAGTKTTLFTFDYAPGNGNLPNLPTQIASYPVQITVKDYYYPDETSWEGNTAAGWSIYNLTTLQNTFYEKDGLFYKLDAANSEAMVVSYNRSIITTSLEIPETFTATEFTSGSVFNRVYSVTQIGRHAFNITTGAPTTLLRSITIPNSVTVLKDGALASQCRILTLVIPDSVRIIGTGALSNMKINPAITGCAATDSATGLNNLTVGSGLLAFGDNALKNSSEVTSLTFKNSPDALTPFTQDPANFNGFQYNSSGTNRLTSIGNMNNACNSVINYSGIISGYLLGSQASKWRSWATAHSCIPNANLTIINRQFAPTSPQQPVADTPTLTSLRVQWSAPLLDGDSAITAYSLQYSSNNGSSWTQSNCTSCQLADSPYLVTGLSPSTSYIFRVRAINAIGNSAYSVPSNPKSTLGYTSSPAFTISPASETVTAGSSTNYQISITYSAASFSISPSEGNGLSFNTSTGVLSGTLASADSAVAYAITGTNIIGTHTETYTVTVIAAQQSAPPSVAPTGSAPTPQQTSVIKSISEKCMKLENNIYIDGLFEARITTITVNGEVISSNLWSQSQDQVSIQLDKELSGRAEIQIFNGQIPLLPMQVISLGNQCAVEQTPVVPAPVVKPIPTLTPTPEPTKSVNTQPTAEMRKVAILNFAVGSYAISDQSRKLASALAEELMKSPQKLVLFYGHTDSQGGVDNISLSKNRAKAVAALLRPLLKGKTIRIGWYAATKPVDVRKTAKAFAQNRRVEIWIK